MQVRKYEMTKQHSKRQKDENWRPEAPGSRHFARATPGVARGLGLQGFTRGYRGLQEVKRGYRELQGVTKGYR